MGAERSARLGLVSLFLGLALALLAGWYTGPRAEVVHARMPENGGWSQDYLTAEVGKPLELRLTSDDVVHGFAVGRLDWPAVDIYPGETSEISLEFDRPGKYTFYCTRWCGPNHWRMRGTIEVRGAATEPQTSVQPLYLALGIDLDAPHPADVLPAGQPSAARGKALSAAVPEEYLQPDYYRSHSPEELWKTLRGRGKLVGLRDEQIWDLVAFVWWLNTTPQRLEEGAQLYAENCAACHGEQGQGNGVFAHLVPHESGQEAGHEITSPTDFTEVEGMLGASPALLQGKILRGGMGTGMPYWGPILTEEQTWALVDYLYSFQFIKGGVP